MIIRKLGTLTILIALIAASCTKDGPAGPAGSNGQQGATGATGATGSTGTNGTNGVSNISTTLYTITPGQWTTIATGADYEYGYKDSQITNADTDAIEVFYQTAVYPNVYRPLPCSNMLSLNDQMYYVYANGIVDFFYEYSSIPTVGVTVKVVVIPPAIMKQYPGTNWKDYNQLSAVINLQKLQ